MPEDTINSFTQKDYKILKRDVLHEGFLRLVRYHLKFRLFKGGLSEVVIRELTERQSAAGILPYDPDLDCVILIEQFRPGALSNPQSPWLLEIVAGVFNTDENPKNVAVREAREEAGCEILDLYPICEYFVSPGGSNEYFHLFCGRVNANTSAGFYGLQAENEDIRTLKLSVDEAFSLVQGGKIKTSPAIISLQWLQLNRQRLKQLWQTK